MENKALRISLFEIILVNISMEEDGRNYNIIIIRYAQVGLLKGKFVLSTNDVIGDSIEPKYFSFDKEFNLTDATFEERVNYVFNQTFDEKTQKVILKVLGDINKKYNLPVNGTGFFYASHIIN
mmetsp:Transcript_7653/g.16744  ORF Transcript_7653/g.16744 Transcript_7653/m.16744 type:complete len:123 (+) Transcript_7653:2223-2591(+)